MSNAVSPPELEAFPPAIEDLPAEPAPLAEFTEQERKTPSIRWYRTKLTPAQQKRLFSRSDFHGAVQTLGYLGLMTATGVGAWYSAGHWPWWATVGLIFLHGTVSNFLINGVHELGHGTVFKTRWLNHFFEHVLAFLGWINHENFTNSHIRHHRYTLHPPDDLEVTLPIRFMVKDFVERAVLNYKHIPWQFRNNWRIARGKFQGAWEMTLYPEDAPEKRVAPVRWARFLFIGHGLVFLVSLATGQWIIPILVSLNQCYGGALFWLCNNTQHVGLQDNVRDFRLNCRTFTLNPFVSFLYWRMNFHTEHHMYPATPCYRLAELHKAIQHELPPTARGLVGVWNDIIAIQAKQAADPTYQHVAEIPAGS